MIVWNFASGGLRSKPSWLFRFQTRALNKIRYISCLYIEPLSFLLNLGFVCLPSTVTLQKVNTFSPGTPCLIWSGMAFVITVLKVLCFWCYLLWVIWNQGFFSYSKYNLLGKSIARLRNVCQYIFLTLCDTLYGKNSNIPNIIQIYRSDVVHETL